MSTTPAAEDCPPRVVVARPVLRLQRILLRWLGLEDVDQLVAGQRRDFDQLGLTLAVKDMEHAAVKRMVEAHERLLGEAIGQLNRVTSGLGSVNDRLTHYERTAPQIVGAKRAYDLAQRREIKRRRALIEANPELTERERELVLRTGELPRSSTAATNTGHGESPAPATADAPAQDQTPS